VTGWKIDPSFAPTLKEYIGAGVNCLTGGCILASLGEQPIGCAVLYTKNSVAYLADATTTEEFRRKGAQTALLLARFEEAKITGRGSHVLEGRLWLDQPENMEKQDLRISYTRAFWTKV